MVKKRCQYFSDLEWTQSNLSEDELFEINKLHKPMTSHDGKVWYRNGDDKLGLCGYSIKYSPKRSSCGTSFTLFEKIDGKWNLEKERLTLCHNQE